MNDSFHQARNIEDVEDEREPKCECREVYDCGRTADEHEIERLKKSLSDSQAREAMLTEKLREIRDKGSWQSKRGATEWESGYNKAWVEAMNMADAALPQSSDSWLKWEKAKVWREAAKIVSAEGCGLTKGQIASEFADCAAALESSADLDEEKGAKS